MKLHAVVPPPKAAYKIHCPKGNPSPLNLLNPLNPLNLSSPLETQPFYTTRRRKAAITLARGAGVNLPFCPRAALRPPCSDIIGKDFK